MTVDISEHIRALHVADQKSDPTDQWHVERGYAHGGRKGRLVRSTGDTAGPLPQVRSYCGSRWTKARRKEEATATRCSSRVQTSPIATRPAHPAPLPAEHLLEVVGRILFCAGGVQLKSDAGECMGRGQGLQPCMTPFERAFAMLERSAQAW